MTGSVRIQDLHQCRVPREMARRAVRFAALLALVLVMPVSAAMDQHLTLARDFAALADDARARGVPILLMVSRSDCPYCDQLVDEILAPMVRSGDYDDLVLIRELLRDDVDLIRDFSGEFVPPDTVADRYRASLTPTVLFLDPQGRELVPRIRGINTVEMYGFYLDRSIDRAIRRLGAGAHQ